LTARLGWLHFGFATLALESEHVAKVIGAKMSVSLRGYDIDVYPLKHKGSYRLLWKNVDKVHSISRYLLDKAYALDLPRNTPFEIIPPAIDLNKFEFETFNFHQPIEIVTVARLEWIKGLIYTVEAMALLIEQGLKIHYTIIGTGRSKDELLFCIHQLGISKWITLLDQVPHQEIRKHLMNTSVYVQYSISEGFCNSVLEAQAMGLLCVVSDGGALGENVINRETGWIVPKRNPKALAACIEEVIKLPYDQKLKISKNARQRVKKQYNLDMQREKFLRFYE
jgi:colanic acid/amylovoran biosynthesis glycosyltransferase